jgi:hypothetical protein
VLRIGRSRRRDRSWLAILASGLGLYAVLAVGFHWFVEPVIVAGRASLPTETLVAYAHRSSEEPATSGHSLRGVAQVPVDKREPPSPTDGVATAKAADQSEIKAPDIKAPKKQSNRTATKKTNDRLVQQSAERRGSGWNFSSSPGSPNYR